MTKSLGMGKNVNWFSSVEEEGILSKDDIEHGSVKLEEGDAILVLSDGICGKLTDGEIERTVVESVKPQEIAKVLSEQAKANGSHDDRSVVAYRHTKA